MTIKELIEKLQQFPTDTNVYVRDDQNDADLPVESLALTYSKIAIAGSQYIAGVTLRTEKLKAMNDILLQERVSFLSNLVASRTKVVSK